MEKCGHHGDLTGTIKGICEARRSGKPIRRNGGLVMENHRKTIVAIQMPMENEAYPAVVNIQKANWKDPPFLISPTMGCSPIKLLGAELGHFQ